MDADDVRRRRKALGLTQAALATVLGVRQNTVSRWEIGEMMPAGRLLELALQTLERSQDGDDVARGDDDA